MTLPLTPRPNCPQESVAANESTTTQIYGVINKIDALGGIKPAPHHQAGQAGGRNLPAPGFALKNKYPGAGITPALAVAAGPILGPKSYTQALAGLAGPGKAKFSCPELPNQAHPPFGKLGFPVGNPCFNQVLQTWKCLSSQSQNGNQIRKDPMTPAAKSVITNDQSGKDRPPASQATVPGDPKNDDKEANQPEEFEMPSFATQIAPEECQRHLHVNEHISQKHQKDSYPSSGIDSQALADKIKAFDYYCSPNAPFGPVHFTNYSHNPDHKPWTLEDLQWYICPDAPKDLYQIVCDGREITIYPLIFNGKYNNPATYLVPMKPPLTPKLIILTPPTSDATGQSSQFLRVLYLALTGLIDSALPAARPWAVAEKALSYLIKLGLIIWWAMPVPASTPPSPAGASGHSWYPDTYS
ncbi:hypothetical protein DSO57_1013771 [Entomophthora muscae]|uniref:Uncharacterized protein n=1 Tax=Entomophthora muscae TaxID=34485 RepID=A0ACC2S7L6_9FUNG|nr:hypothetical protein DSO57_1013771 [Entomophthora muscae]